MTPYEIARAVRRRAADAQADALRYAFRTQTDFVGRIAHCVGTIDAVQDELDAPSPVAPPSDALSEEMTDALMALAGLCIARAALLNGPAEQAQLDDERRADEEAAQAKAARRDEPSSAPDPDNPYGPF